MKPALHHPLWLHLPALLLVGVVLAAIARAWPLPERVAMHFDVAGQATWWGPGWLAVASVTITAILLAAASVIAGEAWARQEPRKRFNLPMVIVQVHLAVVAALSIDFFRAAAAASGELELAWPRLVGLVGAAAAIIILLEWLRPATPMKPPTEEVTDLPNRNRKRLREYARRHPQARASLEHWERIVLAAAWRTPADVKATFNDVDPVRVRSGNTVHVFNIQRNEHRLVAAIHFNTGLVYVLRLMTHKEYDRSQWKDEL